MDRHVTEWLSAYHDGEVHGPQLQQVETHLEMCESCRSELAELRSLSALLKESPLPTGMTPTEQFIAQVGLQLPARQEKHIIRKVLEVGWGSIPVGLLGAWAFAQAVFIVAGVISPILELGFGGESLDWIASSTGFAPWATIVSYFASSDFTGADQAVIQLLTSGEAFTWSLLVNLALTGIIGLLILSWFTSWLARRQQTLNRDLEFEYKELERRNNNGSN